MHPKLSEINDLLILENYMYFEKDLDLDELNQEYKIFCRAMLSGMCQKTTQIFILCLQIYGQIEANAFVPKYINKYFTNFPCLYRFHQHLVRDIFSSKYYEKKNDWEDRLKDLLMIAVESQRAKTLL